jgi:hypothetical protein
MVLMFASGRALTGDERRIPWAAAGLTAAAVAGVVLQLTWSGAMPALDADPSKSGWWRVITSVFMQNGGISGTAWNLITLAAIAAMAEWLWGAPLMLGMFAAGALLPGLIDTLIGATTTSTDPRNFAGSSGATYFLGATLAAALLLHTHITKEKAIALAVPALGLTMWFTQANGHGLVATYGFVLGIAVWAVTRSRRRVTN